MKTLYFITCIIIICFFARCTNGDEDVVATESSPDWFEIKDRPGELNQLLYQIYRDYQFSIFVNDTLGQRDLGVDAYGNPIIYIQLFDPGYYVWGTYSDFGTMALSKDTLAMIKAVTTFKERFLAVLPEEIYPRSLLFVDTINSRMEYQYEMHDVEIDVYSNGIRGYVVGKLSSILQMSDMELEHWVGGIFAPRCVDWINANIEQEELEEFYKITNEGNGWGRYDTEFSEYHDEYEADPKSLGFWRWKKEFTDVKKSVTQTDDLRDFAAWAFVYWNKKDEFYETYKDFERLIRKFALFETFFAAYCEKYNVDLSN
ncbi:hypothetical protein [Butyricimonas hominis]|uniref:Lipoprotein n=1 Tax=Butyricimonas hominis TaxID=2763032 RepID=A0ABR7D063_9BACT|nr:hypothetical protein [Butyricimonas hominis]MBC5621321.1 hypothetical protein [Butyricimonas hominis]